MTGRITRLSVATLPAEVAPAVALSARYLPAVIDGKSPAKQKATLTEGKEVTGNRDQITISSKADADNVIEIKRLAGLN